MLKYRSSVVCFCVLLVSCASTRAPDDNKCPNVEETCNGHDDDCDGLIDEDTEDACGGTDGGSTEMDSAIVADGGIVSDSNTDDGAFDGGAKDAGDRDACGEVTNEICNDLDDDCDGIIDEGATDGECSRPRGRIVQLTTGTEHTCALRQDGNVLCWGNGRVGQLGIPLASNLEPVATDLTYVERIASGKFFSCALRTPGHVACWGQNDWGQLGEAVSGYPQYALPVAIYESPLARSLGVGLYHACIVNVNDQVECWGWNGRGQLGQPFASESDFTRKVTLVRGVDNVQEVAGGLAFTCALHRNGTVSCWGANDHGQLGDGTTTDRVVPALVMTRSGAPLDQVISISLGTNHACAVKEGQQQGQGTVVCWGDNANRAVGEGARERTVTFPTGTTVRDAVAVATSERFSCALRTNSTVWCWGSNDSGQLGNGTRSPTSQPTQVIGLRARALFVGHGESHACAVREDYGVACWGQNSFGQLGNRRMSAVPELTPTRVNGI